MRIVGNNGLILVIDNRDCESHKWSELYIKKTSLCNEYPGKPHFM